MNGAVSVCLCSGCCRKEGPSGLLACIVAFRNFISAISRCRRCGHLYRFRSPGIHTGHNTYLSANQRESKRPLTKLLRAPVNTKRRRGPTP
ncbi:Protein of unknown function [Pyronema omphalodes CBS 100304]|uniref:Uncharacterized protein n=1 Tax=Pyronema omphalodes (strain CBS 100304) TaxID=1076935 RepID=U4KUJ8_PYROM|nr:Protein of unknown function [Pyronema omphalodes CBS 100304]